MKRYFIRVLKFTLYLLAIVFIILIFIYLMSANVMSEHASIWRLFHDGRPLIMIFIAFIFGAIYPFFGFTTVKIYLNKPLGYGKQTIIDMFAKRKYVVEKDEDKTLTLRPKSKLNRITRMNEDMLELDYSKTILTMHGLRRDVYRFKRMLEEFAQQDNAQ